MASFADPLGHSWRPDHWAAVCLWAIRRLVVWPINPSLLSGDKSEGFGSFQLASCRCLFRAFHLCLPTKLFASVAAATAALGGYLIVSKSTLRSVAGRTRIRKVSQWGVPGFFFPFRPGRHLPTQQLVIAEWGEAPHSSSPIPSYLRQRKSRLTNIGSKDPL